MRRRVCKKISEILQKNYRFEKKKSEELTLKVEKKIRVYDPTYDLNYK